MDKFISAMNAHASSQAMVWNNVSYQYSWLLTKINDLINQLNKYKVKDGQLIEIVGNCSPTMVALLFALVYKRCILIPLKRSSLNNQSIVNEIVDPNFSISIDDEEKISVIHYHDKINKNELIMHLNKTKHPGLILFSSGSTGNSKAIVHDWLLLIDKFNKKNKPCKVIFFLLFDHIGGLNTILHSIYNGGCLIVPKDHSTNSVCEAIEKHQAEMLPTSPTFLNLLVINKGHLKYNLDSLKQITYGTETMPATLLKTLCNIFPSVRILQTYGLSELGILHITSKSSDSIMIKFDNELYQTRISEGMLEIKTNTAMLGYLNADNPFTEDGWFKTGDIVKVENNYICILGRASEIINVGGVKVYPSKIENIIKDMSNVEDVVINGEQNPITGQIVKATVKLSIDESVFDFRKRMHEFCKTQLQDYEIPQKVVLVDNFDYGDRIKKIRKKYA